MPESNGNNIELPTPWGGHIKASGQQVVLILLILSVAAIALWQHDNRRHEHERIEAELAAQHTKAMADFNAELIKLGEQFDNLACLVQLNIWLRTVGIDMIENNQPLSLTDARLPWALWECVPEFLTEARKNTVKRRVERPTKEPGPGAVGR